MTVFLEMKPGVWVRSVAGIEKKYFFSYETRCKSTGFILVLGFFLPTYHGQYREFSL
jgi:hypothetical protein